MNVKVKLLLQGTAFQASTCSRRIHATQMPLQEEFYFYVQRVQAMQDAVPAWREFYRSE